MNLPLVFIAALLAHATPQVSVASSGSPGISASSEPHPASAGSSGPAVPTLKTLAIPGEPAFVRLAKDILDVRFAVDPSIAAGGGLFDDAARVPSFDPKTVAALVQRLDKDRAALRAIQWRSWDVDRQIDWRWVYANAEDVRLQLAEEKLYLHRPSSWLEPLANTYIALLTYAPRRADIRERLTRAIPGMVAEMRHVCVSPTARDVRTADGVAAGILSTLEAEAPGSERDTTAAPTWGRIKAERDAATTALSAYIEEMKAKKDLPEFAVIGAAQYEKRLRRVLLLPWSARQLLASAQVELNETDAAMAEVRARLAPAPASPPASTTSPPPASARPLSPSTPTATSEQIELAKNLDQGKLLALYDDIVRSDREFLDTSDMVTVPPAVGPIHARPTPEAMIPLTGDGGSMNPPPPVGDSNVGWWNVEHFRDDWSLDTRTQRVVNAENHHLTGMGPYAVHEGVPGHHLQLSIARLNPDPLRSLLQDNVLVEGWAMYAEEMFWRARGLGDSPEAEYRTLASWRGRIRRVFYDVNVECGDWTLQDGADFRGQTRHGGSDVDEEVMRAINWPAQLICYFAGKMQITELQAAYREKLGPAYTDRKFHDALLAEGSIPLALIRAKLLGEPVPEP